MKSTDQHIENQHDIDLSPEPIETNYPKHKRHPGPSEEAVVEKDENGAGKVLRWIIPALIVILIICWFIVKQSSTVTQ
jgi:hypothetical protein